MKKVTYKDIPNEVFEAWCIHQQSLTVGIGLKTLRRYNEIIKKYPDWFKEEQ